ncbi:GntR family transcriptional regulator [Variovorax sp. RCC_210]|uniref:GntR family transcriptional regulator n=1 Tax=Variovorax sp. RCC_210 TaxID=3239217 RepID=UPI00352619A2
MSPSSRKTKPPDDAPDAGADDAGTPRYAQIAREFTRAIADETYPIGSRLPTEAELCAQFDISRFTAREAIRVLLSAGLVTRRPRIGTVVIAKPDTARYAHDATSLPDLLQYARDTELRFVYIGKVMLGAAQAQDFDVAPGEEWTYALGVRYTTEPPRAGKAAAQSRPFCITRLFLNPELTGIGALLRERHAAVYSLIEREYRLTIERVEQELSGTVLDADDAANLGCEAGAPALRIVRRYYDRQGRLLEVADNVHPSDRFSYRMQLRR